VADLLATSLTMTEAPRALIDEAIFAWHREAAGYKIRHVPATLPDMLKTRAMVEWEYAPQLGRTPNRPSAPSRTGWPGCAARGRIMKSPCPCTRSTPLPAPTGYYRGLPAGCGPSRSTASPPVRPALPLAAAVPLRCAAGVFRPVTVFGPLLAVVYLGRSYIAFRDAARVQAMTEHFDWLVREAEVGARDAARHLRALKLKV
jgi:hypothetical protein